MDESLTTGRPDVSLIVPGYNEGSNIRAFYDATIEAFEAIIEEIAKSKRNNPDLQIGRIEND